MPGVAGDEGVVATTVGTRPRHHDHARFDRGELNDPTHAEELGLLAVVAGPVPHGFASSRWITSRSVISSLSVAPAIM
jgi:hypothetical protein